MRFICVFLVVLTLLVTNTPGICAPIKAPESPNTRAGNTTLTTTNGANSSLDLSSRQAIYKSPAATTTVIRINGAFSTDGMVYGGKPTFVVPNQLLTPAQR